MKFPDLTNQSYLGRLLRAPLRLVPPDARLPILRGPLRGKRWIAGSSNHGCWIGSYEARKQELFARHVGAGFVVFDIGAHVGFYTLLASVRSGPRGRVVAVEPVSRNLDYLRRHLEMNSIQNVEVLAVAVSDQIGEVAFQEGWNSSVGRLDATGTSRVRTTTLDELVLSGSVAPPQVIKMDIEGGEAAALRGGKRTLELHHPTIFLATHSASVHGECCSLLHAVGYVLQAVNGGAVETADELLAVYPRGQRA